ncbi:MAG: hypothetical protein ACE5FJ_01395 [Gemmatimonadales bacterium]
MRTETDRTDGRSDIARRQAALLRLSTEIAAAHDEHDVCRSVVSGLHDEALGYNFLGMFLLDSETGDRVLQASVGWPDAPEKMRVKAGAGISARAMADGLLHYTADVTRDLEYLPSLASGKSTCRFGSTSARSGFSWSRVRNPMRSTRMISRFSRRLPTRRV